MITVARVDEALSPSLQRPTMVRVTVSHQYYYEADRGTVPVEDLLTRSFEFLLQREGNTSILSSFDLTVIARYFPEYESTIRQMH